MNKAPWALVLSALLAAYLRWLLPALTPYAGGADSSGYLWSARLFRHATLSVPIHVPQGFPLAALTPQALVPLGARLRSGTSDLVPTYPTGVPLHLAALNLVASDEGAVKTLLVATATAAIWLLYLLARETGLDPWWALAVCVVFALSPLVLYIVVQPMSDLLATCWAEAAVLSAWRARRTRAYATLAGVGLGVATLVRPTSVLLLAPIAAAMPFAIGAWIALVSGVAPFVLFTMVYQVWAYGRPFESGYGDLSVAFSLAHVWPSVVHYVTWLPRLASWLVLCAAAAPWAWRGDRRRWTIVMLTWILVVFGAYALYPVTAEAWWMLRFVLPAFPPLVIAAITGLRQMTRRLAAPNATAAAAIAAALVLLVRSDRFRAFEDVKEGERTYRDALQVMATNPSLPPTVLMVQMSGAANYYAPDIRFVRFDELTPEKWTALRHWQSTSGQSIGASLFPFERDQLRMGSAAAIFPCAWQSLGAYRHITFWRCPAP